MPDYDCYSYAIELGFTEQEARDLAASKVGRGQDATVLRRLATFKGLPSMKPKYPRDELQSKSSLVESSVSDNISPKPKPKRKRRTTRTKA